MKLICIKQESKEVSTGEVLKPELTIGNEYTVVDIVDREEGRFYNLFECDCDTWFHYTLFAQIADLDETALVNESFEEKYCVPVNAEVCSK